MTANIISKVILHFLIITSFLFILILPTFSGASEESFAPLKGYWHCQEEGVQSSLEFQSPNKLIFNGQPAAYQLLSNVLRVQEEYGLVDYYFQIQAAALIIFSPDGGVSYCQKAQKPSQQAQAPRQGIQQSQQRDDIGGWPPPYAKPSQVNEKSPSLQTLLYKFVGRWDHVTSNTLTNLFLKPDGTYEDAYESGYSGTFTDQGGFQTGNWGAAGAEQAQGTWRIEGSLRQGRIYLTGQNGNQRILNYQVHVKGGEPYWGEYFFNNSLYSVKYIYR